VPIYQLTEKLIFPHPKLANEDGLLAWGGDLSAERLLLAYSNGIFPWFDDESPILWWALDPRMVLFPEKLRVTKSLKQSIRNHRIEVKFDENFELVIRHCAEANRKGQDGTWINSRMIRAYVELHEQGFAHSAETYYNGELVGGLYGVSLGRVFCGESMFYIRPDASKVALFYLVEKLKSWNFDLIDSQQDTSHMRSMGAELITLEDYLERLKKSLKNPTFRGKWC
jgi:leucyl/phenylalanyl-tRNA--protein transferase